MVAGADVECVFRFASHIAQNRQIAPDTNRVSMLEEKVAIAAKQILDVVFSDGEQKIDILFIEQPVEFLGIKRGRLNRIEERLAERLHREKA